jgi:hypothetical protein
MRTAQAKGKLDRPLGVHLPRAASRSRLSCSDQPLRIVFAAVRLDAEVTNAATRIGSRAADCTATSSSVPVTGSVTCNATVIEPASMAYVLVTTSLPPSRSTLVKVVLAKSARSTRIYFCCKQTTSARRYGLSRFFEADEIEPRKLRIRRIWGSRAGRATRIVAPAKAAFTRR